MFAVKNDTLCSPFIWFCLSIFSCNWTLCLWAYVCARVRFFDGSNVDCNVFYKQNQSFHLATHLHGGISQINIWFRLFTLSSLYKMALRRNRKEMQKDDVCFLTNESHIVKSPSLLVNVEWHSKMTRRVGMWKTFNNKIIVPIIRCHLWFPNVVAKCMQAFLISAQVHKNRFVCLKYSWASQF